MAAAHTPYEYYQVGSICITCSYSPILIRGKASFTVPEGIDYFLVLYNNNFFFFAFEVLYEHANFFLKNNKCNEMICLL